MVFNNSKRMDLVQDMLKEEKKKKGELKKKKSSKNLSLSLSGHSKGSVTTSSYSYSSTSSDEMRKNPLHCKNIMKLNKSWEVVKKKVDPQVLGNTIVTRLVQADPSSSMKVERCHEIGATIVEALDCMIFLLGPDFDEDDAADSIERLHEKGVALEGLAKSLPQAIIECMPDMAEKEKLLWTETMKAALMQIVQGS